MPFTNEEIINKSDALVFIQKDVSVQMPSGDSEAFLRDTIGKSSTLPKLKPIFRKTPAGKIDTLNVGRRKIREVDADITSTDVDNVTDGTGKGQISYSVHKVFWDEWIKNDDVWYTLQSRGQDVETALIDMIQEQFGVDLQDLIFNGDTEAGAGPDQDFLKILDGFVKKMKASSHVTDIGVEAPTINHFMQHLQLLPEKYKNRYRTDITWFLSQGTYDKLVAELSARQTPGGDAILVDGDLKKIGGYKVEVVADLQSGFASLTPMSNLKPVFTRELKYVRTGVGPLCAKKDATYHILHAYLDCVIREIDAVAYMIGDNL